MSYKWYVEYEVNEDCGVPIVGRMMLDIDQPSLFADDITVIFEQISEKELCFEDEVEITGITKIYQN